MTIRLAQTSDLDFFVDCVTREGWLGGTRAEFEAFLTHDPQGCFVAEEGGDRIGMIVATAYDTCGFLGALIVQPDRRGRGIGRQLMEHAIGYLRQRGIRSIYLDGDTLAVPLYERLGFHVVCKSLRFLGQIDPVERTNVRPMTADDLVTILALDCAAFGADRSFFLKRPLDTFPQLCYVWDKGSIRGYIMGQPGHGVVTVGPWYVQDKSADPLSLLRAVADTASPVRLRVGVLERNVAATSLMRSLTTFAETESSWRMVLGPDIGLGVSPQLFAVGSPAKG
ncbi:MAG: GNAT family N-acetyltransferase [candidate division Zixibacteria bacterium]|nr:GNAT family N-acetyltransferase [candidate division Zixibacteria bacterium]